MITILAGALGAAIGGLQLWRWSDRRFAARVWHELARHAGAPGVLEPARIDALPAPARRMFSYLIEPGTPIRTVVELEMSGEIGLGTRERPNYLPMRARQILAPPHGFVWEVRAGRGMVRFSGSDGAGAGTSWSRFWLGGTIPIARAGGGVDHRRAAFGRVVGEAVFWAPAALLPRPGVAWSAVDDDTTRVSVTSGGLTQTADVTVAADGRPLRVVFPRWSDANPEKTFRLQPFGGSLSEFRRFDGFRLPTRVEAGNHFGTAEYFPFFRAQVDRLRFVDGDRPAE